jgi:dTDP-4-amino-4,6-dideoxy-D-galactose acyltransferase
LTWDSEFFDVRIARLNPTRISADQMTAALEWCEAENIDCLYFLAEADHAESARLAAQNNFAFVDIRLTLDLKLESRTKAPPSQVVLRDAVESDLDMLEAIARVSHTDSRFYYDGHFSREKCDLLYETWIVNAFNGKADKIIVAEQNGKGVGYITALARTGVGIIDLVGVHADYRGEGIGAALNGAALDWMAGQGIAMAEVITQGRNIPAQRLYQRFGFKSRQVQLWYHRWFT